MSTTRRWAWAAGGLTLLAAAAAATTRPLALFELPPDPGLDTGPGVRAVQATSGWDMWTDPGPARALTSVTGLVSLAFLAVLIVALVLFIGVLVRAGSGRRLDAAGKAAQIPGVRFDRVSATRPVADVVDQALGRLAGDGPVSDAVIACWVDLQRTAERLGLPRQESETSAQYAYRLGSELDVSGTALQTLAGLYREARFSDHSVGSAQGSRARAALDELRSDLSATRGRRG